MTPDEGTKSPGDIGLWFLLKKVLPREAVVFIRRRGRMKFIDIVLESSKTREPNNTAAGDDLFCLFTVCKNVLSNEDISLMDHINKIKQEVQAFLQSRKKRRDKFPCLSGYLPEDSRVE